MMISIEPLASCGPPAGIKAPPAPASNYDTTTTLTTHFLLQIDNMEHLSLYLVTFNCARTPIDVDPFAAHLFDALLTNARDTSPTLSEPPELLVFCVQEIAPIAYAFLGGSYLTPYFDSFDKAVHQAVAKQWNTDTHYVNLVKDNVGMTGLMVYAREDVTDKVSRIDTAHVGLGYLQMGNKGAVGARLGYATGEQDGGNTDLTFVAAHLAPMEDAYEHRNADWRTIVERLVFSKQGSADTRSFDADGDSEEQTALLRDSTGSNQRGLITPTTYLFLGGDLNYRTGDASPMESDRSRFPKRRAEPGSQAHYSQLLKDDQLMREMRKSRCFHGLQEAPIKFPPTYKYAMSHRNGDDWNWSLRRWPSWCDRFLFLDSPSWMSKLGKVVPHAYDALPLFATSDHRPVALSVSVPLAAIEVPDEIGAASDVRLAPPFPIDPDWSRKQNAARTREIAVGCLAYLGLTWEGNGLLLATTLGVLGTWFVLQSLLVE